MNNPRYFDGGHWFYTKINFNFKPKQSSSTGRILDPVEFDWYQNEFSKIHYIYIGSRWNLLDLDNSYGNQEHSKHDLGYSEEW